MHGGGEPTLHWELLQRLVTLSRDIASSHRIGWWGYIATHGVLSTAKANWLAEQFDLIGLSCDGPPEIHDRQRPTRSGRSTSDQVERTARCFRRRGTPFVARATITPATIDRQVEIVDYLHAALGAGEIRFEAVYQQQGFTADDAPRFADAFLAAQDRARSLGCDLSMSGARLDEIHGPFCNVLRQTLQITPDGAANACFLHADSRDAEAMPFVVGQLDEESGELQVDSQRIDQIRRRVLAIPGRCEDCANMYHCARDCPDACPITAPEGRWNEEPGFRCRVQRLLAQHWIRQAVDNEPEESN
jgi:radical SAM protein with 4Fe4S-binding SPASM domain